MERDWQAWKVRVQPTGWGSPSRAPRPAPGSLLGSRSQAPLPAPGPCRVMVPGPRPCTLGFCWGHGPMPRPAPGPCRGHSPGPRSLHAGSLLGSWSRAPLPAPGSLLDSWSCAPPHSWVPIPHPHRSPAAQEAQRQLSQLTLRLLEGQHRPRHLPWQGALRAQRSWEVAEERVQEAGGLLCCLAARLWGPLGHAQGIGGAGELLPGSSVFSLRGDARVSAWGWGCPCPHPAALSAHFSLLPLGSQGHTKTRAPGGRAGPPALARSWF